MTCASESYSLDYKHYSPEGFKMLRRSESPRDRPLISRNATIQMHLEEHV